MYPTPNISPVPNGYLLAIDTDKLPDVSRTLNRAKLDCRICGEIRAGFNGSQITSFTTIKIRNSTKAQLEKLFNCRIVEDRGGPATVSMDC